MPELPEVETIVRLLRPTLIGKTIQSAELFWERTLVTPSPEDFMARVRGQKIEEVFRRAKFFCLQLTNTCLLIHLRMSGDMLVVLGGYQPGKQDRLILHLSEDT